MINLNDKFLPFFYNMVLIIFIITKIFISLCIEIYIFIKMPQKNDKKSPKNAKNRNKFKKLPFFFVLITLILCLFNLSNH